MGWKNVKEHYKIGHIVQVTEQGICIGSPYISNLICIRYGKPTWGKLGPSSNADLARYFSEMEADPAKLKALIDTPDTFEKSIFVYTYDGSEIQEKQCEEFGWPNVTHDGLLMYENTFSCDRDEVVRWAIRNAECSIEAITVQIDGMREDLAERQERLATRQRDLQNLTAI